MISSVPSAAASAVAVTFTRCNSSRRRLQSRSMSAADAAARDISASVALRRLRSEATFASASCAVIAGAFTSCASNDSSAPSCDTATNQTVEEVSWITSTGACSFQASRDFSNASRCAVKKRSTTPRRASRCNVPAEKSPHGRASSAAFSVCPISVRNAARSCAVRP